MITNATVLQQEQRLKFSKIHFKYLLRAAITHFACSPLVPFNFYQALRKHNPVLNNLKGYISCFIHLIKKKHPEKLFFIALALMLNAYPPGMHC